MQCIRNGDIRRLKCQRNTNTVILMRMSTFTNILMWTKTVMSSRIHMYMVTDPTTMSTVTCIRLSIQSPY